MSSIKPTKKTTLRLRVFAGPNGSGKSTIIQAVRDYRIKRIPVDFGIYINADDIASALLKGDLHFKVYEIKTNEKEFIEIALKSGLINKTFSEKKFRSGFKIKNNHLLLTKALLGEHIAQITAHFLRVKLLELKKKFSFETVFSHHSKLDIMSEARKAGYKVYLYFVSTESPDINKYRVQLRKDKGGHDVPPDKIESRYYRSLDLMFKAAQLSYQCYFFDNSGEEPELFAHFKITSTGKKKWDKIKKSEVPEWFKKYYSAKVKKRNK
ncbi:MAG TPA: hypothetical protein VL443_21640 [Cyclobacteriaceae bacterium]|nr:hypothetical protein [Cyclobacteriaceae bacterium]